MGSKKIEDRTNCNITFSKRHGLLKKAYELSILSVSEVAVITYHPSKNKLCYFSHPKRAEDILIRFLNMPDHVQKVNGQEFRGRLVIPNKDLTEEQSRSEVLAAEAMKLSAALRRDVQLM